MLEVAKYANIAFRPDIKVGAKALETGIGVLIKTS
jgi:hypothetical protein